LSREMVTERNSVHVTRVPLGIEYTSQDKPPLPVRSNVKQVTRMFNRQPNSALKSAWIARTRMGL
jgi:hypothetical protein